MSLKAVVIGSGWAAEGHVIALRAAGVTVAAICGRTPATVNAMAAKHGVPHAPLDWRQALEEFRPDIVSITVPAAPHREMATAAARQGIAVVCEKPLASNADQGRRMLDTFQQAGLKHGYGASSWYSPAVLLARQLVADGLIGHVREVESLAHFSVDPRRAYPPWAHDADNGGGLLGLVFPHQIAQVLHIVQSRVIAAAGEGRQLFEKAPEARAVHDFRDVFAPGAILSERELGAAAWHAVTAAWGYSILVKMVSSDGQETSALFQATGMPSPEPDTLLLCGTRGALCLTGPLSPDRLRHFDLRRGTWEEIPVPRAILDSLPDVSDPVQRDWNQLYRDFVADLQGREHGEYPTFHLGVVTAQITDVVRSNRSLAYVVL